MWSYMIFSVFVWPPRKSTCPTSQVYPLHNMQRSRLDEEALFNFNMAGHQNGEEAIVDEEDAKELMFPKGI